MLDIPRIPDFSKKKMLEIPRMPNSSKKKNVTEYQ